MKICFSYCENKGDDQYVHQHRLASVFEFCCIDYNIFYNFKEFAMFSVTRKSVFGVSDQVRHKPDCTVTEDGQKLGTSYLKRGIHVTLL